MSVNMIAASLRCSSALIFELALFQIPACGGDTMLAELRVSCPDDKGSNSTGNRNLLSRFCVPGKRGVSLTAVDHFWTLKSTAYWVVSQVTFIVPPPLGLLSIAMAS